MAALIEGRVHWISVDWSALQVAYEFLHAHHHFWSTRLEALVTTRAARAVRKKATHDEGFYTRSCDRAGDPGRAAGGVRGVARSHSAGAFHVRRPGRACGTCRVRSARGRLIPDCDARGRSGPA